MSNLLKESDAYYDNNDYYEQFSIAEDGENKVSNYIFRLISNKIVLDAGCGTGKFLPIIENNAKQYIGVDLSSKQLRVAKKKAQKENTIFIESNLDNIKSIKDKSIDIIISSWVLGTIIDEDERQRCLRELKRVLKANGQIILIENDLNSEFEKIRNRINDNRTRDYNNWILANGFEIAEKINTYFYFNSYNEAKKCFEVIYGSDVANKIKSEKIEHKIVIFSYQNN